MEADERKREVAYWLVFGILVAFVILVTAAALSE
jgi:hypothetical protein